MRAVPMFTSAIALSAALALGGAPAFAQSSGGGAFLGTPVVNSGSVVIDRSVVSVDTITVGSSNAVVTWTPNDTATGGGPITFLPSSGTATFRNDPTLTSDFTILNRIVPVDPTRSVEFDGLVVGRLRDIVGGPERTGGGVWFYSPGGVLVGAGGVINVGNLVLTTGDPVRDTAGAFYSGGNFSIGPAAAGSRIGIASGANIVLDAENSFVAMVAPIIDQSGFVNVNGSAAYVAAQQAQLTFNQGLFDISVIVGSDGQTITHSGTTTGPASTATTDNHRIYMVAVPKNDAVTMLFGPTASLGFDLAGAANVDGNAIVLSAGRNITEASTGEKFAIDPVNANRADITLEGGA